MTMKVILNTILEMSLYGSIAIVIVMLFRLIFKRFPKKTMILIWIVAAFRLLCPYNFDTGVGLANLIPQKQLVQETLAPAEPAENEVSADPAEKAVSADPAEKAVSAVWSAFWPWWSASSLC